MRYICKTGRRYRPLTYAKNNYNGSGSGYESLRYGGVGNIKRRHTSILGDPKWSFFQRSDVHSPNSEHKCSHGLRYGIDHGRPGIRLGCKTIFRVKKTFYHIEKLDERYDLVLHGKRFRFG